MSTAQETRFFIKQKGRIRGPYPISSLMSMQQRRAINRETLVSENRREGWVVAESLSEIFPENLWERKAPTTYEEMQWYYRFDKEKKGPFSFDELIRFASTGVITQSDYVISETMTQWVTAAEIDGLTFMESAYAKTDKHSLLKYAAIFSVAFLFLIILPATIFFVSDYQRTKRIERENAVLQAEAKEERLRMDKSELQIRLAEIKRYGAEEAERRADARAQKYADAMDRKTASAREDANRIINSNNQTKDAVKENTRAIRGY